MKRSIRGIGLIFSMLALLGAAPRNSDHQKLRKFLDELYEPWANEVKTTVRSWRRAAIIGAVEIVMGQPRTYHERDKVRLDVKVEEEVRVGDLIRRKISYQTDAKTRVKAYLFIPP